MRQLSTLCASSSLGALILPLVLIAMLMVPGKASASLINDDVLGSMTVSTGNYNFFAGALLPTMASATVSDPGVEFSKSNVGNFFFNNEHRADFAADTLTISWFLAANTSTFGISFIDMKFTSLDWVNMPSSVITGVTRISNSFVSCPDWPFNVFFCTQGDLLSSDVTATFGPHNIDVHIPNTRLNGNLWSQDVVLQAVFQIQATHDLIPEPTTLALMGLGLAGIGWKRRKAA